MPATLHTIDSFYDHVQAEGFQGITPGKNDVMGDNWARSIGEVFERTTQATSVNLTERKHKLWMIWQWLYCELAGQRSRIVASPPAMRMAGIEISDEDTSDAIQLLLESQNYLP